MCIKDVPARIQIGTGKKESSKMIKRTEGLSKHEVSKGTVFCFFSLVNEVKVCLSINRQLQRSHITGALPCTATSSSGRTGRADSTGDAPTAR